MAQLSKDNHCKAYSVLWPNNLQFLKEESLLKFVVRLLKLTLCLFCVLGAIGMFSASPSLALPDDCGEGDRVPPPACVDIDWSYDQGYIGANATNNCSHQVTLKFDKANESDALRNINPGRSAYEAAKDDMEVKCCPRYNPCSDTTKFDALRSTTWKKAEIDLGNYSNLRNPSNLNSVCFSTTKCYLPQSSDFSLTPQSFYSSKIGDETSIFLESIEAVQISNTFGHDEVYIEYIIDQGRPKKYPSKGNYEMQNGDVWPINLPLSFKDSLVISLYEHDPIGTDSLGSHTYLPDDMQPDAITVHGHDDSVYILYTEPN
ncbi:hypothetical protein [Okeania sp. SIO2B3]|uniref:hypothetical protein n=1 Tax=Okeania sp. SIO2B3 TaxID=2607784 RepID=UPI0013BFCDDB|nr:hypothetical protein [Okeania sp. SIO2B3]NET42485.1 hypothetical protein [Okeania sp. SIO2B3]